MRGDGFDTALWAGHVHGAFDNWASDDIRVVAYWKKKPIKRTLALMPDGSIEDLTDQVKDFPKDQVAAGLELAAPAKAARIEERDSYKICRYLITMAEVLEESDWPGMHIPVVPVIGEEVRVGRDVYRHGIVRYARDLQRMENYYASAETEVIALQPKAPWLGTKKQFQDITTFGRRPTPRPSVPRIHAGPAAARSAAARSASVASQAIGRQDPQFRGHEGRHRHL
jgi:hypothetical protein